MGLRTRNVEESNLLNRLLRGISSPGRPVPLAGRAWGLHQETAAVALRNSPSFLVYEALEAWQSALDRFGLASEPDSASLEPAGASREPDGAFWKEKERGQQPPRQPDFRKELGLVFLGLEFKEAVLNGSVIEIRANEKPGHWETAFLPKRALPRGRVYFAVYNASGQKLAWQTVNL